jgi:hypothetical protein
MRRFLIGIVFAIAVAAQTKKVIPRPDKKDVVYLVHASTLVQTEVARPTPKDSPEGTIWSIPGESSLARTPLALPIFTIAAAAIDPQKLRLLPFEVKGSRREVTSKTEPILITVSPISGSHYRIETVNEIPNGEYALNVAGSNQFFCFTVF